ncbi:MAG TPA: ligase-associated DNA damage response endonuclease PdeM [Rubrivivax sp.]
MSLAVEVGGRPMLLLAQRAAFLPAEATLLVADAHLGKAQSFRRLGVPVPGGSTAQNLDTLTELVERHGARAIVFLGDLLHSRHARSPATLRAFETWRARHHALALMLVRGNHDLHAGDPPPSWRVDVVDEPWSVSGLALCHKPNPADGAYTLAGHVHPAAWVGRGIDRLRLPCFHFGPRVGLLPAFGDFTGMHVVQAQPGDRVFVVAADGVHALPVRADPTLFA